MAISYHWYYFLGSNTPSTVLWASALAKVYSYADWPTSQSKIIVLYLFDKDDLYGKMKLVSIAYNIKANI